MTDEPTDDLGEVIERSAKAQLAKLFIGGPGSVISYNHLTQKAKIQPVTSISIGGEVKTAPVLSDVPVYWSTGGGCSIVGHLSPGDRVWLLYSDRSLDEYLTSGRTQINPTSKRRFHPSDAIALPGLVPFSSPLQTPDGKGLVLGEEKEIEPLRLEITPGEGIALGNGTDDLLSITSALLEALSTATTTTSMGPQPLLNAATYLALKAKIDRIKKG